MKTTLYAILPLLFIMCFLPSCNEGAISSEFFRIAKVKGLSFSPNSESDNRRIEPIIKRNGYNYRLRDWRPQWAVASDNNHLIYRGGAAASANKHMVFIIVWSNAQDRVVFSELGHSRTGTYPSGLKSSP